MINKYLEKIATLDLEKLAGGAGPVTTGVGLIGSGIKRAFGGNFKSAKTLVQGGARTAAPGLAKNITNNPLKWTAGAAGVTGLAAGHVLTRDNKR